MSTCCHGKRSNPPGSPRTRQFPFSPLHTRSHSWPAPRYQRGGPASCLTGSRLFPAGRFYKGPKRKSSLSVWLRIPRIKSVRSASVMGFSSRVSVAIFRLLTGVFTDGKYLIQGSVTPAVPRPPGGGSPA